MRIPLAVIILFFLLAGGGLAFAQNIDRDGDLTATEFDELGFDTTGLVGWWQLNGNAHDSSGLGNNGTIVGATATTDRFATANRAMNFDGNDYIDAGSNTILGTSAFTIYGWFKMSAHASYGCAFEIGTSASGRSAWLGWSTAVVEGTSNSIGGGFYGTNYGSGITDTGWHCIALTFTGGAPGTSILYADGVSKATRNYTPNLGSDGVFFGKQKTGVSYWYTGLIDEVKVFNRALSADEILAMYNHEKGKFSVNKADGSVSAAEFVEDPTLEIPMRSKKANLTVKGQLIEQ